jgi:hypothetical protein
VLKIVDRAPVDGRLDAAFVGIAVFELEAAAYRVKIDGLPPSQPGPFILEVTATVDADDHEDGVASRFPTWEEVESAATELLDPGVVLTAVLVVGEEQGRKPGQLRSGGIRLQQVRGTQPIGPRIIRA